jgi:hypothetical protein
MTSRSWCSPRLWARPILAAIIRYRRSRPESFGSWPRRLAGREQMAIRDAIRSFWAWLSGGPRSASDQVPGRPTLGPEPASETARLLSAANDDELRAAFKTLMPDQRGYITAEDYEEITAEELDEFSVAGRQIIADLAVECRCTVDFRPGERRVYFTKK